MNEEILQSDYHSTETPHFDEEWTVLTARPVVPLEEVSTARRRRSKIKILGLFCAALLLGAVSALVVTSVERSRAVPISPVTSSERTESAVTEPAPEPSASDEAKTAETESPGEVAPSVAPKTVAVVREKPKSATRASQDRSDNAANKAAVQDDSEQPKPILFDEIRGNWEERRARRVRRQERRDRLGRRHRDLLRIDEIFEGRRP